MLLDRSTPENPNSTSEKDRYIELFGKTSDNILYREEDANPDDNYISCDEAKKMIAELARNPYLYDSKDYRMIPFDCFTCNKTGGIPVLRLLVRKRVLKIDELMSDADALLGFDAKFEKFVTEINKMCECSRKDQLKVMKTVQKIAIEKINTASEEIESGESILEEVKNE